MKELGSQGDESPSLSQVRTRVSRNGVEGKCLLENPNPVEFYPPPPSPLQKYKVILAPRLIPGEVRTTYHPQHSLVTGSSTLMTKHQAVRHCPM